MAKVFDIMTALLYVAVTHYTIDLRFPEVLGRPRLARLHYYYSIYCLLFTWNMSALRLSFLFIAPCSAVASLDRSVLHLYIFLEGAKKRECDAVGI